MSGRSRVVCMQLLLVGLAAVATSCGADSATAPAGIAAKYNVTILSTIAIQAPSLNDAGQVVGYADQNALFENDSLINLGSCTPEGINDAGRVACWLQRTGQAAIWDHGTGSPLTFSSGFRVLITGVNDSGITAGMGADVPSGLPGGTCKFLDCGFIADASGHGIVIAPPPGTDSVGVPLMSHGTEVVVFSYQAGHAPVGSIWRPDSTSAPYPCAGLPVNASLKAVGGAEVVGYAPETSDSTKTDATVCKGGVMQSLGPRTARANDISRNGLVVGTTDDGHGFVWENGQLTILDQIAGYTTDRIVSAECVNDSGQIVAIASNGKSSSTLLLTPK